MKTERKNEAKKDIDLFNFIQKNKKYNKNWEVKKTSNKYIQEILDETSKSNTGNRGEPDFIYVNEDKRLLLLIENKDSIKQHQSKDGNNPKEYAIDGIKHYLSFFKKDSLKSFSIPIQNYLNNWSIVGLAISGNINDQYNHLISTFILENEQIRDIETKEVLDEHDYLAFFENIDMEKIVKEVSESSKRINTLLRSLDSQKRPILLSGLMICLFTRESKKNDFKESYIKWERKQ